MIGSSSYGGEQAITDGNCIVVRHILSNISGCTGPIFAIFSPYESAIGADDESVPYFPICRGMLPWQPNNIAVMKAN